MLEINCLYVNDWLIFFFYEDDIVIISMKENATRMRIFEKALMKRFEIKILETLQWLLSIRIIRDRLNRKLWLCQNSYIAKMTSKFNLEEIKCSKISLTDLSIRLDEVNTSNSQTIYAYQQRVKSLNFAAIVLRFDIAFVTVKLTQFLRASLSNDLTVADKVISYLYEIRNLAIKFSDKQSTKILICASDAAFADDELIRRNFDDYLF